MILKVAPLLAEHRYAYDYFEMIWWAKQGEGP
jgi:hypothetical protein